MVTGSILGNEILWISNFGHNPVFCEVVILLSHWYYCLHFLTNCHIYRPQRSWAKVIFSQACVCPQGGCWVSQHALQVSPWGGIPACLAGQSGGGYPSMPCRSVWGGYPSMPCRSVRGGYPSMPCRSTWGVWSWGGVSNFSGGSPIFWGVSNFSEGGVRGTPSIFILGGEFFFDFCFLWEYTPTTPPPESRVKHMVNERPVRILLECILVYKFFIFKTKMMC